MSNLLSRRGRRLPGTKEMLLFCLACLLFGATAGMGFVLGGPIIGLGTNKLLYTAAAGYLIAGGIVCWLEGIAARKKTKRPPFLPVWPFEQEVWRFIFAMLFFAGASISIATMIFFFGFP